MGEQLLMEYIAECYEKKVALDQKLHAKAMHLFKEEKGATTMIAPVIA